MGPHSGVCIHHSIRSIRDWLFAMALRHLRTYQVEGPYQYGTVLRQHKGARLPEDAPAGVFSNRYMDRTYLAECAALDKLSIPVVSAHHFISHMTGEGIINVTSRRLLA